MARKRKAPIGKIDLEKVIGEMLQEYGDEIADAVSEQVDKVAKDTRDQLESTSPRLSGDYARNWVVDYVNTDRLSKNAVIHVEAPDYRLTHLLEFGHALKRGGREIGHVDAKPHIAEAEKKAIEEFEQAVKEAIEDAG